MPGIDADFICHRLAIHKEAKPVAQRKRKVGGKRREAVIVETQKLLNTGFIREVRYTTWLANVVLVKKHSGKWRMCIDYTDLNKACPKASYPWPSIDSRVLQDAERRYQMIEKLALALVTVARRLRPYFQSHQVVVKTDYPIKQILRKPELVGRMIAWSIELSEFSIQYESRGPLKAQCLADFVAELTPATTEESQAWTLDVDGSSNSKGGGAGIILEGPNQVTLEKSLKFGFKVTNNQAEYEALLAGLRGTYQAKDTLLQRYFHTASQQISSFDEFSIKHVPREQNARADLLSKLANTKRPGQHRTIIQETLHSPSLDEKIVNVNDNEELGWMADIWNYLKEGTLPKDKDEARKVRMRLAKFIIIDDELFKRGISTPLLKCLTTSQAAYVVKEIHQEVCGMHSGARSMAARVLRAGYYWPTLKSDCQSYIQKCKECQQFGKEFEDFPRELGIKHFPTSVEHPQTNGQAEAANKVILRELKKWLGNAKGQWPDMLPSILWAYHCTPQSTTQETPYRLTYGADAMIPVEVGQTSHRHQVFNNKQNNHELATDLDLLDELRDRAKIHEEACKLRASRRYNSRVRPRSFRTGDLVWRLLGEARKDVSDGKLTLTWGNPF
uniref:Pro-Pol polyprotein n=1 Tax=Cajanus cajan TaxID=3821 RepID=A0A151QN25_CAJCA|nr:Pro-Pol polyprotein [Cajanus cajan]